MAGEAERSRRVYEGNRAYFEGLARTYFPKVCDALSRAELDRAISAAFDDMALRWQEVDELDRQRSKDGMAASQRFLENIWDPAIKAALREARALHATMN